MGDFTSIARQTCVCVVQYVAVAHSLSQLTLLLALNTLWSYPHCYRWACVLCLLPLQRNKSHSSTLFFGSYGLLILTSPAAMWGYDNLVLSFFKLGKAAAFTGRRGQVTNWKEYQGVFVFRNEYLIAWVVSTGWSFLETWKFSVEICREKKKSHGSQEFTGAPKHNKEKVPFTLNELKRNRKLGCSLSMTQWESLHTLGIRVCFPHWFNLWWGRVWMGWGWIVYCTNML